MLVIFLLLAFCLVLSKLLLLLSFLVLSNVFGPPATAAALLDFKDRAPLSPFIIGLGKDANNQNGNLCFLGKKCTITWYMLHISPSYRVVFLTGPPLKMSLD